MVSKRHMMILSPTGAGLRWSEPEAERARAQARGEIAGLSPRRPDHNPKRGRPRPRGPKPKKGKTIAQRGQGPESGACSPRSMETVQKDKMGRNSAARSATMGLGKKGSVREKGQRWSRLKLCQRHKGL